MENEGGQEDLAQNIHRQIVMKLQRICRDEAGGQPGCWTECNDLFNVLIG